MAGFQGVPAGYSGSEDDAFEEYDGYYFEKIPREKNCYQIQKTEIEIYHDTVLDDLKNNDMNKLRDLLDKGIRSGFDIDSPINGQWNLLYYACSYALPEMVKFLIEERGACLNTRIEGETPLMVTCMASNEDPENVLKIIKILCESEPKLINRTNYLGENALMLAAHSGHLGAVKYLIKIGESCDNINNSGRNVLFYAIEGNHVEIAKLLFDLQIDLDVVDCYGNTAKKFALDCNATKILELFPPEEYKYETPVNLLSYSNFESIIPGTLNENFDPSYFPDIVSFLRAIDYDRFIELFAIGNISLEKFLTTDDEELKKIGIPLPCQRQYILLALHKFFTAKWTNNSIYIPKTIKSHLSPIDLIYIFSNVLRQTIILKSQLTYLKRLSEDYGIHYPKEKLSTEHFEKFHDNISQLIRKMKTMKVTRRPLLIERQAHPIECNVIKRSKTFNFLPTALKLILPTVVISFLTFKVFIGK